jgi:hypothetical protein
MRRLNGFAFLLLAAATLPAKPPDSYPFGWFRVQGGSLTENNSPGIKKTSGYGAGFGMWFNRGVGWELDGLAARLKDQAGLWQANENHLDLSLLFAPPAAEGSWKPYLRLGGGTSRLDQPLSLVPRSSTRPNYVAGLGTQVFLGSVGLFTLEARGASVRSRTARTEMQYLVGLGLRFGGGGGGTSAPAPANLDRDLFPQRPLIEPAGPEAGRDPVVQPAAPGEGPAVQVAPADGGSSRPLIQKAEP